MRGNSLGKAFCVTTYGESHGKAIGVVIDGCPAGIRIEPEFIQRELRRRRPGQSSITSPRNEPDEAIILSGIFNNVTLGTPIHILIENKDARPEDYAQLAEVYRPSHADYTWQKKYGIRDYRGGGRASARETAARVAAGCIAREVIAPSGIKITAYVSQIGTVSLNKDYTALDLTRIDDNPVRCPDEYTAHEMLKAIEAARAQGDSLGGKITCIIQGCPPGLGEPVFDKLHADLGKAMLSINAVKGFEIGSGFRSIAMKGSEHNDPFSLDDKGNIKTSTNYSGGIQGGISNGMDIYFNVAFKPVATIRQKQKSVDMEGNVVELEVSGRHDPCVVPRAVPVVEAMAAIVIADHLLRQRLSRF